MTIEPAHYKKLPDFILFAECASNCCHKADPLGGPPQFQGRSAPVEHRTGADFRRTIGCVERAVSPSTGVIAGRLSSDVTAAIEEAEGLEKLDLARAAPDTEPKWHLKLATLAEIVERQLIGGATDRLVPGTVTGRDGHEHCDGFTAKGPTPSRGAWPGETRQAQSRRC